jgi:SPP1 gp7 family putative phage head morphogenesis protein
MIKLNFNDFWKKKEQQLNHVTVHRLERAEEFYFFFVSKDNWKYYTQISLQEVLNFASEDGANPDDVVQQFFNVYAADTLLVEDCDEIPHEVEYIEEFEPEYDEQGELIVKDAEVEPGEPVEDSEDYADFYKSNIDSWKKVVVSKIESAPSQKTYSNKFFGDFIRTTLNAINTKAFLGQVNRFVKIGLNKGLESAEVEVGVDVGFTKAFDQKLMALTNQQFNGYTINGKMWYGIKGATKEIQARVIRQVAEDVQNKVTRKDMVGHIEKIFDGVAKSQAERIARTETTRFINEGKLTAYKESGTNGYKAYAAVMDNKTSDICRRLNNKYFKEGIPLDDNFRDDVTGKSGPYPPHFHSNCRCVIEYRIPPKLDSV